MKSIPLLVSGLFIVGTLLWLRAATQRCLDSDFCGWRSQRLEKTNNREQHKGYRSLVVVQFGQDLSLRSK